MTKKTVAVVGGGMAGLSAAYRLMQGGVQVEVFESEPFLGGRVQCRTVKGHPVEFGGFLVFPWYKEAHRLFQDLGIDERLTPTPQGEVLYFLEKDKTQALHLADIPLSKKEGFKLWIKSALKILPKTEMSFPDLTRFRGQTVYDHLHAALGEGEQATIYETFFDTVSQAYCYGPIRDTKMAFMAPIVRESNFHGDVGTTSFFSEGSTFFLQRLIQELEQGGVKIHLGAEVHGVDGKTLQTKDGSYTFDAMVFAQTVSPDLYAKILPHVPAACWYTHYLSFAVEFPETPLLGGMKDWAALFYVPDAEKVSQLSSVVHLPKFYGPELARCFILNILVQHRDPSSLSREEAETMLWKELRGFFPEMNEAKILEYVHWKKTMPVSEEVFVESIRAAQGKNGYYFAGDFLGAPSIETAVATGSRAAEQVLQDVSAV